MALYQPTNITPSTFAGIGGGVIDASDNVSISWQVNGNSAMTGFSIAVYRNTTASSLVHTFTETLSEPFYGTDALGNPVFYVYEPGTSWASAGLSNGNGYKLKITMNWSENGSSNSVAQTSESVFSARAKPTLSVSPSPGTLSSVAQTFTASYSQAQGDSVSWVRWVLSDSGGNVLDDTGTIYTGLLSYSYDGFFSGQTYSLRCTVQTASGAEASVTYNYAVSYDMAEQTGGISLFCNADDSVSLTWSAGADIPGVPSAEDYGTIWGGVLHLAAERSILWNKVNGEDMSFSSPYCFAWRGTIAETATENVTVNSGTWELWKQYDQTGSTSDTVTVSSLSLTKEYTGNTTGTASASATTAGVDTLYNLYGTENAEYDADEGRYIWRTTVAYLDKTLVAAEISAAGEDVRAYSIGDVSAHSFSLFLAGDSPSLYCTVKETVRIYRSVSYWYPSQSKARNPVLLSTTAANATVTDSGSSSSPRFTVELKAYASGTYSATFSYDYSYTSSDSYSGSATKTFPSSTGTLTGVSVTSTTGTSATVTRSGNSYTVTVYYSANSSRTVTVRLNYTYKTTGSDSYRSVVTGTKTGAASASVVSTTATRADVTFNASTGGYTVTMYGASCSAQTAVIAFVTPSVLTGVNLAAVSDGTTEAVLSVGLDAGSPAALLTVGGTIAGSVPVPEGAWQMLAAASPDVFRVFWFNALGSLIRSDTADLSAPLPAPVSSVSAEGEQDCDYTFLSRNAQYDFSAVNYVPGWDANTLFYASFASDLQAGTVSDTNALSVAIYRREGATLVPVGTFGANISSITDYAIRSGKEYMYEMFYIAEGIYSAGAESASMCRKFRQHTLIEAEEDASLPGVYHPVNVWRFRDNLDAGAYTNQNQPALLENFTKYPLWQPSSPSAKTGTLTALLGRFEDGTYTGDDAEAMEALFALSASVNPLFYRDMKGNLYMVRLAGPITQTINNKTGVLEVSVSVPWVEVGDADNVKIYITED